MKHLSNTRGRGAAAITSLALGIALVSCATGPGTGTPTQTAASAAGTSSSQSFHTGRLTVVVHDDNGRPLERANVEVVSGGATFYRSLGHTNRDGSVTFSGVPETVNVTVTAQTGSFSRDFVVSPSGTTEMRMIVQTFGEDEAPEPAAEAGQGGRGFSPR